MHHQANYAVDPILALCPTLHSTCIGLGMKWVDALTLWTADADVSLVVCVKAISDFNSFLKTIDSDRDIVLPHASIVWGKGWII